MPNPMDSSRDSNKLNRDRVKKHPAVFYVPSIVLPQICIENIRVAYK